MNKPKKPTVKQKSKSDEDNYDFMKTNKDNIKNIIRNPETLKIINNLAIKTNKIVIHAYNFIKLYCIHLFENNLDFPEFDKEYIMDVFKAITTRKCGSGGYTTNNMPQQLKELTNFFEEHYKDILTPNEELLYDKMSYVLAYEAIDMTTNIYINVRERYLQQLNKLVNITFKYKDQLNQIKEKFKKTETIKEKKKELYEEFKQIKNDILNTDMTKELQSKNKYHKWIKEHKSNIIPNKNKFDNNNIMYDLKSNTSQYLKCYMYIGKQLEKLYDLEDQDKHTIRLFNTIPLRTNIVVKHITIDTCALISNFLGDEPTTEHLKNYKKDNNQYDLWNRFFDINKRVFKKKLYSFNYMIRTDGVSCCILFKRNDKDGKPLNKDKRKNKEEEHIDYIEKVEWTDKLKKKKIVVFDPGLSDLLYFGSKDMNGDLQTFRYTQNQRRLETGTKKYSKIIDSENKKTIISDNKTVKELEAILSQYNSKTNDHDKFKKYLKEKNKLNQLLFEHYEQTYFRKFKLNRYTNSQKSESKMLNNFGNKFGSKEDVVFIMGDYDKGNNHMKGLEPVINKKFRRIFRNAGYETYLINEFKTSKLCNCCQNELEKFMVRQSNKPRDHKLNKKCLVNGLLHHDKDVKPKCEIVHNRDKNAVQNMLNIVTSLKTTGMRPKVFCREKENATTNSFTFHDVI